MPDTDIATQRQHRLEECAHDLFTAQARLTPAAVAVEFKDQRLSYRELDERSNQLAHYLQALNVGPETLVGLCVERSPEMMVGMLGVLKAGGAYVPLDPAYPHDRLAFMLNDAGIEVLLTQQHLVGRLPECDVKLVKLDADWESISRETTQTLDSGVTTENLAYVIYTSGSTGTPKGVLVQHRGLGNLAHAQARAFRMNAESRVLQFASISFDASVSEIFKTLLTGATLCLAPQDALMAGPDLTRTLRDAAITTVTLPPTALATLSSESLPALQTIVVAGEACTAQTLARWAKGRHLINAYGPTEVTVCATIAEQLDLDRITIGRPMNNMQVYLLDPHLEPVPAGVPGELYVGGVGLARGYHCRPDLTAERFIPHPFSTQPGERLYRTGDLARYLDDGQIEFLGRMDHQVKIKGFRVELGEIEAVLLAQTAVKECVVLAREDRPGEKRLVAYVTRVPNETAVTDDELKGHLKERLPEYMVPTAFVTLETLPLTPNGKVDRQALPAPEFSRSTRTYAEPGSELESLLARLWCEVLGVDGVGAEDSFFELGGDSIKAAILLNRLQEVLGEVVYVVALFDAPTLRGLAEYLNAHYAEAVSKLFGKRTQQMAENKGGKVSEAKVEELRRAIRPMPPSITLRSVKNPRAIFILSPPRSGSTLLRVMLGGHPALFAPPELQLLNTNSLQERLKVFSGRDGFWLEGTVRALMEIHSCSAEQAQALMTDAEDRDLSTADFYLQLQQTISPRLLVDKTPSYALDIAVLRRAEEYFEDPLYVHLLRHPCGMIRSFEAAKLEQIFRYGQGFKSRELAELIWVVSHENIREFLKGVPRERQRQVRFEALVKEPARVLSELCEFVGVELEPRMLEVRAGGRMTDGIHGLSRMLGDIKFESHKRIDADVAERWKQEWAAEDELGEVTCRLAHSLGYMKTANGNNGSDSSIQPITRRTRNADRTLAQLEQLSEEEAEAKLTMAMGQRNE